jgi:hypothetical protein
LSVSSLWSFGRSSTVIAIKPATTVIARSASDEAIQIYSVWIASLALAMTKSSPTCDALLAFAVRHQLSETMAAVYSLMRPDRFVAATIMRASPSRQGYRI